MELMSPRAELGNGKTSERVKHSLKITSEFEHDRGVSLLANAAGT
jgi:hypothetical protein